MLTFNDYQTSALATAIYPEKHSIIYPALGLVDEAGEAVGKVKKWLRGDKELNRAELAKEIGDVLWYAAALSRDIGYTLEECAQMNINKLLDRQDRGVLKGDGDNR